MKKQNKTKEDNQNVVGGSAIAFCFCVSWPFVWVALLQKNNNSIGCAVFFFLLADARKQQKQQQQRKLVRCCLDFSCFFFKFFSFVREIARWTAGGRKWFQTRPSDLNFFFVFFPAFFLSFVLPPAVSAIAAISKKKQKKTTHCHQKKKVSH